MPMMPFIGVRISWLMVARNVLLALLASSASCFALTIASRAGGSSGRSRVAAGGDARSHPQPLAIAHAQAILDVVGQAEREVIAHRFADDLAVLRMDERL